MGDVGQLKPRLYLPFTGPTGNFYLGASISGITAAPTSDFSPNPDETGRADDIIAPREPAL